MTKTIWKNPYFFRRVYGHKKMILVPTRPESRVELMGSLWDSHNRWGNARNDIVQKTNRTNEEIQCFQGEKCV